MLQKGLVVLAFGAMVVVGCTSDSTEPSHIKPSDAYTTVVRWEIGTEQPTAEDEPLPVIYVTTADGSSIEAGVQAAVTANLLDDATVRFSDNADDALDLGQEHEPVRDDGVLLVVDGITDELGSRAELGIRVYRQLDDDHEWLLTLVRGSTGVTVSSSVEQPPR